MNHGRLPAKIYSTKYLVSAQEIRVGALQDQGKEHFETVVIFPDDIKGIAIEIEKDYLKMISAGTWFLGLLVRFSYANNLKGNYGIVIKYRSDTGGFEVTDESFE